MDQEDKLCLDDRVLARVVACIQDYVRSADSEVTVVSPDMKIRDLVDNSIDWVEITVSLERTFRREIPEIDEADSEGLTIRDVARRIGRP